MKENKYFRYTRIKSLFDKRSIVGVPKNFVGWIILKRRGYKKKNTLYSYYGYYMIKEFK